jgi:hypothetical protein
MLGATIGQLHMFTQSNSELINCNLHLLNIALNSLNSTNTIDVALSIIEIQGKNESQDVESLDFNRFQTWLTDHAANIDGLELRPCEWGNGVFATKDFEYDQLITRIPQKIMLSTAFHQRTNLKLILAKDPMLKSMDSLVLTIQLLQEDQDEESFYRPYLDVLPRRLPKLPLLYTTSDLELLKGSHVQCIL